MSRGYISTIARDGRPLVIYYIHRAPTQDALGADLGVLAEFAAAWTRGELDVTGKAPFADAQPCDVIVVTDRHHMSTNSPHEAMHFTVSPASESSWASGYARSGVHVYSGGLIEQHLEEAMNNNLATQAHFEAATETPAGYYDDGTPYFWSESSQVYYYYGQDGQRHRTG